MPNDPSLWFLLVFVAAQMVAVIGLTLVWMRNARGTASDETLRRAFLVAGIACGAVGIALWVQQGPFPAVLIIGQAVFAAAAGARGLFPKAPRGSAGLRKSN